MKKRLVVRGWVPRGPRKWEESSTGRCLKVHENPMGDDMYVEVVQVDPSEKYRKPKGTRRG